MATDTKKTTATEVTPPVSINVEKPLAFDGQTESKMMTTTEVMDTINSFLRPVLAEYVGCSIMMNNNSISPIDPSMARSVTPEGYMLDVPAQSLYVNLYFRPTMPGTDAPDGIVNLIDIAERARLKSLEKKNAADSISEYKTVDVNRLGTVFGGRTTQPHYDLTDETKELLSEFMFNQKNPHYERHIHETYESVSYGATGVALIRVSGFILEKLLSKIFGTKDENGNQYQYATAISNLINDRANGVNGFLLNITRADADQIRALAIRLGMIGTVTSSGYIPCR